jgi:gentisate 1,2-dioxygenase
MWDLRRTLQDEGAVVIEGERLEWYKGDIFAVPA